MRSEDFAKLEEISRLFGEKVLKVMIDEGMIESYKMMDRYCEYDAEIFSKGNMGIVEFKKRNCGVDTYPTVLMEHKKYEDMKKIKAGGYYYISIFNDNVASVYRFDNIETDPRITTMVLNCPHPLTNKQTEKKDKLCFRIPTNINNINI